MEFHEEMEVLTDLLDSESIQSPSSESGYSSTNPEEQVSTGVNLCLVCRAAVATKHVHYGAASACNSCRAFFRRAAQSGNHAGNQKDHHKLKLRSIIFISFGMNKIKYHKQNEIMSIML